MVFVNIVEPNYISIVKDINWDVANRESEKWDNDNTEPDANEKMNKMHEKYYIPLSDLTMDMNEYKYRSFCVEFMSYAKIYRDGNKTFDCLKEFSRAHVQHDIHTIASQLGIDRGDFAKVNNLEGLKSWYDMIVEYRRRLPEKDLYIQTKIQ